MRRQAMKAELAYQKYSRAMAGIRRLLQQSSSTKKSKKTCARILSSPLRSQFLRRVFLILDRFESLESNVKSAAKSEDSKNAT